MITTYHAHICPTYFLALGPTCLLEKYQNEYNSSRIFFDPTYLLEKYQNEYNLLCNFF
jgi:hypothetical protein